MQTVNKNIVAFVSSNGTESHPLKFSLLKFFCDIPIERLSIAQMAFDKCVQDDKTDTLAEMMSVTLRSIVEGKPVPFYDFLSLCWLLKDMMDKNYI